jgi:GNAT superfamily N-acetyltransferase
VSVTDGAAARDAPEAGEAAIRLATPADLEPMVRLLGLLFSQEPDFRPDPHRQRRGLARMLAEPERRLVVVAETGGEVVGMVTVQIVVSTAEGGDAGLLEDLVVEPAVRRRGIARRLVRAATAWATSRGATRLQLLADRANLPALAFYERMGWQPTRMVALRRGGVPGQVTRVGP